jgi:CPA2 family monovalent cation:H+ antiporter-2
MHDVAGAGGVSYRPSMHTMTPLISTLVGAFVAAFVFGLIANRLRVAPIAGFLVAGIVIGPFTPGFVADPHLAPELAEIGVILLMFGVGLHFSLADLLAVRRVAVPGAVAQILLATALGAGLATFLGWDLGASLVFGLALSVASTVVLIRGLEQRSLLDTPDGRIAIGWLIVEDLVMVLALVLLPAIAGPLGGGSSAAGTPWGEILRDVGLTLGKVVLFVVLMLAFGRRFVPWLLARVASSGSQELFTLGVLAIALGVAFGSAYLFGVSFALGAFFAGMLLNESDFSHRAAADSLPLRDAFAVLFFVSVGMLFDPWVLVRQPWAVLATVLVIVVGKSIAAWVIVRAFGHSLRTALLISVSLAQIGEFSFILAALGVSLGLLSPAARDLVLAAAILSILLNPLLFIALDRLPVGRVRAQPGAAESRPASADHIVVVGHGRVGRRIAAELRHGSQPLLVIESRREVVDEVERETMTVLVDNAAAPGVLEAAAIGNAARLIVAIPNVYEAGQIVARARAANAGLSIIARAHSDADVEHLERLGASHVVMGERETARRMVELARERSD